MQNRRIVEKLVGVIEENFQGYEIFIESNSDYYRGGFEWSISKDDVIWHSDLAFNIEGALSDAQRTITDLNSAGQAYS
jgi:hypothetical protein